MNNQIKSEIIKNVKWLQGDLNPELAGGQSCGHIKTDVTLHSEEMDIKITIGHYRSIFKNRELAMLLLELAIDDIIK